MSFVKFPRARYTKPGAGKIFLFLLDQCNDFQIQLFARMNSSISLLGERWDSLGWQTFPMVEMLPIIKSQHCCKQSHCQVSRLTLTMILTAFCSRHFAPPSENYENLWGAAWQSWFPSIEIRKAITRKDPILSNKYLPHSQISWFTHFFAPPQMKCKTRKYFKYFIYILVFPLHGHVTLKNANYYFQDYRNQN